VTLARRIRVTGIVQGVGFRPFVWRLARELGLVGWVRNDSEGVDIAVEGSAAAIEALLQRLRADAPPLARVDSITALEAPFHGHSSFTIDASPDPRGLQASTAIGPDVATCPVCIAEMFDPAGRRWRHAFITCTHCGPRYTVTRHLPYDRPQTSLAPFPLCADCEHEYTDPADRRFHAETTCCPICGPRLALHDAEGQALAGDPITATLAMLQQGQIVALKGLGGFHLACDARNAEAVARLRQRKNREEKPFAIMVANGASLTAHANIGGDEQALLESRERPVVLLRKTSSCDAAFPGIAPGIAWLGAMLPYTPIHFLLFHEAAGRPAGIDWLAAPQALTLVMTSANPGGEPIVSDNDEARQRLTGIADAFLDHDRAIVARCDDSVLRLAGNAPQFIRRSRGFTPTAIRLPRSGPSVLALGGYLKNTICLTRGDEAFLSPHVGDLDNAASCGFLEETVARMIDLLEIQPERVAHDLHPDFFASRYATDFASRHGILALPVQHHAAHIAAVAAEHRIDGPVLGLALDGVGLGSTNGHPGGIWGGELLRLDGSHGATPWQRLGHLAPLPLPGGDRAAREPWRMAAAALHRLGRGDEITRRWPDAGPLAQMLERGLNCPETSSAGRLFDAAAGLLGIKPVAAYEGQAAMLLEGLAEAHGPAEPWANGYRIDGDTLDFLPALDHLAAPNADPARAAAQFHATLAAGLAEWTLAATRTTGLRRVALGGGCFLNRIVSVALRRHLEDAGIEVLEARLAPPNDGGLALGQAWIALQTEF